MVIVGRPSFHISTEYFQDRRLVHSSHNVYVLKLVIPESLNAFIY